MKPTLFPHLALLFAPLATLLGNAGVFDGSGSAIRLYATDKIQMVSEQVEITPHPADDGPVRGDLKHRDYALYACQFTLKNLTAETVSVQVGFPLDAFQAKPSEPADQAGCQALADRHRFRAEADGKRFPLRYAYQPHDGGYALVFLWDMTFKPHEALTLRVFYKSHGLTSAGSTRKRPYLSKRKSPPQYLDFLSGAYQQSYTYITATGNTWAPPIEEAVFTLYNAGFESYLDKRGYLEASPNDEKDKTVYQTIFRPLRNGQYYRLITTCRYQGAAQLNATPARQTWQPARDGAALQWRSAPYQPAGVIIIDYIFTVFPKNAEGLAQLLESAQILYEQNDQRALNFMRRRLAEKPDLAQDAKFRADLAALEKSAAAQFDPVHHKNIADVILEFYGIPTHNPDIQDFLDAQSWYPAENPPPLDPALKEALLRLHCMEPI